MPRIFQELNCETWMQACEPIYQLAKDFHGIPHSFSSTKRVSNFTPFLRIGSYIGKLAMNTFYFEIPNDWPKGN
jgi:hypothetical protein